MATVKENVARMIESGVPEDKIAEYIQTVSSSDTSKDMSWGEAGKQAISNIPESALQFGKDLAFPFLHPIQTGKGLYTLGSGLVQKAIPGEQGNEWAANAMGQAMKDRYGGLEEIKNTLATDPVGMLGDAAALVSGGGTAVRGAGLASKSSKLANVGKNISRAAGAIDPINIAKNIPGQASRAIPQGVQNRLVSSAIKLPPSMPLSKRDRILRHIVEKEISPSQKGFDKLRGRIESTNKQIDDIISRGAERGDVIDPLAVAERTDRSVDIFRNQVDPVADLNTVRNTADNFLDSAGDTLSPRQAQDMKKGTYRQLNYEKLGKAGVSAQKDLARGLKEELERLYPEIGPLNKLEGADLEVSAALDNTVARLQNREPVGLGALIFGSGMGASADNPGRMVKAVAAYAILTNPRLRVWIASQLNKARKMKLDKTLRHGALYEGGKAAQVGSSGQSEDR